MMNKPRPYDTTLEQLEKITADKPPKSEAERLSFALERAKLAAHAHSAEPDDPPACIYSAVLDCAMTRIGKDEAKEIIESAGLMCCEIKRAFFTKLVITGFAEGQGTRRTEMVKAFVNQLRRDGIRAYALADV